MAELIIKKGQEFEHNISENINESSIFYAEYLQAASLLDELVGANSDGTNTVYIQKQEYENNIIAFCGDRGEGKSSIMLSFVNSLCQYHERKGKGEKSIFDQYENIGRCRFVNPLVIDPSLFDDTHSILDIILAELYKSFTDQYNEKNKRNEADYYEYEKIVNKFQKVYREVSLIKNQKKILDDEFDYDGDIGKLSRLGESTHLKSDLKDLLDSLIMFMSSQNSKIIIAIDDLDMCCTSAYRMAEDIRKYLIIPNVIIVMAVKIQQLESCIRENNLKDFERNLNFQKSSDPNESYLKNEIDNMTERYVTKLIPRARRIFMPKIQQLNDVSIIYDNNGNRIFCSYRSSLVNDIIWLIYQKTGMIFMPEGWGCNEFVLNNLRDAINLIVTLLHMADPREEQQYLQNIKQLQVVMGNYLADAYSIINDDNNMKEMIDVAPYLMNANVNYFLNETYQKTIKKDLLMTSNVLSENMYTYFTVLGRFNNFRYNTFDLQVKRKVYKLSVAYTFRLNEFIHDNNMNMVTGIIGEYIWGNQFQDVIPQSQKTGISRDRFNLNTVGIYNTVLQYLNGKNSEQLSVEKDMNSLRITRIENENERDNAVKAWFIVSLISNCYNQSFDGGPITLLADRMILYSNHKLNNSLAVSMENYLVGLCNLYKVAQKVNYEILGVSQGSEVVTDMVNRMCSLNSRAIKLCRMIAANPDMCNELLRYCKQRKDDHKGADGDENKAQKLTERFLNNIVEGVKFWQVEVTREDLQYFKISDNVSIDMCELYADLLSQSAVSQPENDNSVEAKMTNALRKKMTEEPTKWEKDEVPVVAYLKAATAQNAKKNIENMVSNIQRYRGEYKKMPEGIDINKICDFYRKVLKIYQGDSKAVLSEALRAEYKLIAKMKESLKAEG